MTAAFAGGVAAAAGWDTCANTWVASDGLGRSLPTHAETGPPKGGRTVGIFDFLWNDRFNYRAVIPGPAVSPESAAR